jgi:Glyoxalase/Bleomycin resistance protein/Dioxygenase superfamily
MTVSEGLPAIVDPWERVRLERATLERERSGSDGSSGATPQELFMGDLNAVEIKAFVPARDFALSKQFYEDLGFTIAWSDSNLAYLRCGDCSFLLQNFYHPEHAGNFMMHLLVADVEAWWRHAEKAQLASKYGVRGAARRPPVGHARLYDRRPNWRSLAHRAEHTMRFAKLLALFPHRMFLSTLKSDFQDLLRTQQARQ